VEGIRITSGPFLRKCTARGMTPSLATACWASADNLGAASSCSARCAIPHIMRSWVLGAADVSSLCMSPKTCSSLRMSSRIFLLPTMVAITRATASLSSCGMGLQEGRQRLDDFRGGNHDMVRVGFEAEVGEEEEGCGAERPSGEHVGGAFAQHLKDCVDSPVVLHQSCAYGLGFSCHALERAHGVVAVRLLPRAQHREQPYSCPVLIQAVQILVVHRQIRQRRLRRRPTPPPLTEPSLYAGVRALPWLTPPG